MSHVSYLVSEIILTVNITFFIPFGPSYALYSKSFCLFKIKFILLAIDR